MPKPKLLIFNPRAGDDVDPRALIAQGICKRSVTEIIGAILDPAGVWVAKNTGELIDTSWKIEFVDVEPGKGYCLEVRDARTGYRLACVGPFDVGGGKYGEPGLAYPGNGANFPQNGIAYGFTPNLGEPVQAQVTSPTGGALGYVEQSQGPPAQAYWQVPFSNLPLDNKASTSLTARDKYAPAILQTVTGLTIQ